MKQIKVYLWDFDGVLINSNFVREFGFKEILNGYPKEQVEALLNYHRENGGLSRYVKFRYFFERIRKEAISEDDLGVLANRFSMIMKELLVDKNYLIDETLEIVKTEYSKIPMHIVSGSDQEELRFLCKSLNINNYFLSISGSPTPKKALVKELLFNYHYNPAECVLIGDSYNDYEAAEVNGVNFYAYNNAQLVIRNTVDRLF